jgi:hypothetical protein
MTSLLDDAFARHIRATERLLDAGARIEAPEIDLGAYGEARGRIRAIEG